MNSAITTMGTAKTLVLDGEPFDQGFKHGEQAREEILANLERVSIDDSQQSLTLTQSIEGLMSDYRSFLAKNHPAILEEIRGIAEGAQASFDDILLLNNPVYIASQFLPQECSQILIGPSHTANGEFLHAKTRDFGCGGEMQQIVLHRFHKDGEETVEMHTAGTITWPGSGVNSHGVSISTSGVWSGRQNIDLSRSDSHWFLINSHLLLLGSRTVEDVWTKLNAFPRMTALNIVVCDGETGAAFEATADTAYREDMTDGFVVRANHYMTEEIRELSQTEEEYPSTYNRVAVVQKWMAETESDWTFERLFRLLQDHEGYPNDSICRHVVDGEGADTVSASIASPGRFWMVSENPCLVSDKVAGVASEDVATPAGN